MATRPVTSMTSKKQQSASTRSGTGLTPKPIAEAKGSVLSERRTVSWGDRFALKVWGLCFLLMALMNAYNLITGLLRGWGSN